MKLTLRFYWAATLYGATGEGPAAGAQGRKDRPPLNHTHALRREKGPPTAKLQIYWSGNKYKYLVKKLLWRDVYTAVFHLDPPTPALTPDPLLEVRGHLP